MSSAGASDTPAATPAPRAFPKPGDKSITMAAIARATGVSQGAISSLLNDRDYGIRVSEKTRDRVFKVCREMGYLPNDLRAVVRMYPHLGSMAVLCSNALGDPLADAFARRVLSGLRSAAPFTGCPLEIAHFDAATDYNARPDALPHSVTLGVVTRFFLLGPPSLSLVQTLLRRGHPVVLLDGEIALPGVTSILPDYADAARRAIVHLAGLGHQRMAILAGPFGSTHTPFIELNRGVKAGLDEAGHPIENQTIIYGDLAFENGIEAADQIASRDVKISAVFSFSDAAAAGVLFRLRAKGGKAPACSVIGCGDDVIARLTHPALTTIRLPAEEVGRRGAAEMEARLLAEDLQTTARHVLPVELVERASCHPAKA